MADVRYCEKCRKTMNVDQFYGSNNFDKYPEGKMNTCKKCLTMHVDNFNPDTYLWILQECDVPYIPDKWNEMIAKWGKDRSKLTGTTIIGRYLSAMKLKQWRDYRWKDTEFLQEVSNAKKEEAMKRQGYEAAEIAQVLATAQVTIPQGILEQPDYPDDPVDNYAPTEDYFARQSGASQDDFEIDLTDEDRTYLRLKWGKTYRPEEWVKLEQLYEEMMNSYDIQGAGHIDNLKLLCKTSLKANQLIDMGDVEGFQKMSKVYDSLMKSGKFTAAQNKVENGEEINSIGELVAICEKEGFIPKYYVDGPQDKADRVIADMQQYTHDLISNETNLDTMIESAARQMAEEAERIANAANESSEEEEDNLFNYNQSVVSDDDFSEMADFIEEQRLEDEEY